METAAPSVTKKLKIIALFYFFACLIISARLFYLQIYLNKDFYHRSQQNFLRFETINSRRGNILDCNGKLLATNKPITNIYWHGTGNRSLDEAQLEALETISEIIMQPIDQSFMNDLKFTERTSKKMLIFPNVSFEQLSKITELFPNHQNIAIETELKRCYPHGPLASHVIGYISSINSQGEGKMGIEKIFEYALRGQQGTLMKMINSVGSNLYVEEISKAFAGNDIITTIDLDLQQIAESVFPIDQSGSLIIMNPRTGAIKTIVSHPTFDPSIFLDPIRFEEWKNLQERQPFLNRALCCYPPASPFKLVTLSAAIEQKIISPETITYCRGFTRFRGRKYHCAQKLGHGALTVQEAVAQSCNILFFELAKKLSIDVLADYANRFGLGQKTNVMLPEAIGLIPTTEWKQRTKGERWWPGENLSAVIGQSYLLVTPLQTARMIASIFTGYLINPRIIESQPIEKHPLHIKGDTLKFLRKTMKAVVSDGTAHRLHQIKDSKIYAKTGTAQTSSLEKKESGETKYLEHGWLAAYVKLPQQDPYVMVLLIENVGSSKEAIKIGKQFIIAHRNMINENKSVKTAA